MAITNRKHWTREEYLEFERASDRRHEYLDGEVFAMVGGSLKHAFIAGSTNRKLLEQLENRGCYSGQSDIRVKVSETGLYTYPDVVVVCGEPRVEDNVHDTLLNPIVIVEVLSPSTEAYDRGKKFRHYMMIESLQEYVLIAQDSPRVEHYQRQAEDRWIFEVFAGLESAIKLPSIDCTLNLADIYRQVSFDEPDEAEPDTALQR